MTRSISVLLYLNLLLVNHQKKKWLKIKLISRIWFDEKLWFIEFKFKVDRTIEIYVLMEDER